MFRVINKALIVIGLVGLGLIWVRTTLPMAPKTEPGLKKITSGKSIYATYCSPCHGEYGKGLEPNFPPIEIEQFAPNFNDFKRLILNGLEGEIVVNDERYNGSMPSFQLSEEEIRNLYVFIQNL